MVGKKLWQFQIHRQSTVGSSENAKKRVKKWIAQFVYRMVVEGKEL